MISVVIPIFNEEETLPELYERVTSAAEDWDDGYEIIAVDDGSTDATPRILQSMNEKNSAWKVIHFSRNFGHQAAISAGLVHASGDAVIIIDGDLQDPPEVIVEFIEKWRAGFDVVYAIRKKRKENLFKRFSYSLFYRLLRRIASIEIPLDSGDFCVMDRRVVDVLNSMPERERFVRGLRSWAGFRQVGLEYNRDQRFAGQPKYTFSKLVHLAIDGLFSFSTVPIKLANLMGFILCMSSILFAIGIVIWRTVDVPLMGMKPTDAVGWASLLVAMLLLFGMQFLMIGVLGEYIARIFNEVKGRPYWIVSNTYGVDSIVTPEKIRQTSGAVLGQEKEVFTPELSTEVPSHHA